MTVWMLGSPFVLREEWLGHFLCSGGPHGAFGRVPHISWLSLALGTQFNVHKPVIFFSNVKELIKRKESKVLFRSMLKSLMNIDPNPTLELHDLYK